MCISGEPPMCSKRRRTSSTMCSGVGRPRRRFARNAGRSDVFSTVPWHVSRTAAGTRALYTTLVRVPGDHEPVVGDPAVLLVGEVLGEHLVAGRVGADLGEGDGLVGLELVDHLRTLDLAGPAGDGIAEDLVLQALQDGLAP